jgi:hypothetical protein
VDLDELEQTARRVMIVAGVFLAFVAGGVAWALIDHC